MQNRKLWLSFFGRVIDVMVSKGDRVTKGQRLLVIESMKTEFVIQSPSDSIVKAIHVVKGEMVQDKEILVDFESMKKELRMNALLNKGHDELRAKIRDFAEEKVKPVIGDFESREEFPVELIKSMKSLNVFGYACTCRLWRPRE